MNKLEKLDVYYYIYHSIIQCDFIKELFVGKLINSNL